VSFQNLNLDETLLRAVEAAGYTEPSDIQRQAIPFALEGRDLMASAQTGTGKTAAFVLPALQRLLTPAANRGHGPRVLILTPTRELAGQIRDHIRQLGRFTRLRSGSVVGGEAYPPQQRLLREPLDLLVATPGRLLDHMDRGRVDYSRLELLVLDEADRMLDMGFLEDVERIAKATPADRQTLLFSATLEGNIARIAARILREPERVQVANVREQHASITQVIHQTDSYRHKGELLEHILGDSELDQAIVFTATKRGADDLARSLQERGHASAALHGDMSQYHRRRTVDGLRRRQIRVLVATDVAARGLDIRGLSHVVNFDLPNSPEDYVHRIGRTGRGGDTGTAISLVSAEDWPKLARIERLTGRQLERSVVEGLEPTRPEPQLRRARPKRGGYSAGRGGYRAASGQNRAPRRNRDF
jgi:superfamily II DNA/RNA helicase